MAKKELQLPVIFVLTDDPGTHTHANANSETNTHTHTHTLTQSQHDSLGIFLTNRAP